MRRWPGAAVHGRVLFQRLQYSRYCLQAATQNAVHPLPPFTIQPEPAIQPIQPRSDPYALVAPELSHLRGNLLGLLGSTHPGLSEIARYYFLQPSKQLRSLVVLLFSRATNGLGRNWDAKLWEAKNEAETGRSAELDRPLKHSDVLNNPHPAMPNNKASFQSVFQLQLPGQQHPPPAQPPSPKHAKPFVVSPPLLLPTQFRLGQIVEMIHIASVLHDDVHDPSSDLSLGPTDPPSGFGNKLYILGGDFLLGRASTALARLGESEVVELIAGVISNVVEGEMLRMQGYGTQSPGLPHRDGPKTIEEAWDTYLSKTYLKTASLVAKSARAAVVLGGSTEKDVWKDVAYAYGRNLGIAYQLVQDTLDYEAGGENIEPGVVTGPALFAREEYPELQPLIRRNLAGEGDIELAVQFVSKSSGIERTRLLAQTYADKARQVLLLLPDSETKSALDVLTDCVVDRTW